MATKLLKNHEISPAIINMIIDAERRIVLVSPYIQLWGHLEIAIKSAVKREVDVSVFFRKDKRAKYKDTLKNLVSMGVQVFEVDILHAKIYASEREAIATSMNLHKSSAQNSIEFAIQSNDSDLLNQIQDYVDELVNDAKEISRSVAGRKVKKGVGKVRKAGAGSVAKAVPSDLAGLGYCIRCKAKIDRNPAKPLCRKCFSSWSKFGDDTYQEKYCHACGKPNKTSMAKPECYKCFKAE